MAATGFYGAGVAFGACLTSCFLAMTGADEVLAGTTGLAAADGTG